MPLNTVLTSGNSLLEELKKESPDTHQLTKHSTDFLSFAIDPNAYLPQTIIEKIQTLCTELQKSIETFNESLQNILSIQQKINSTINKISFNNPTSIHTVEQAISQFKPTNHELSPADQIPSLTKVIEELQQIATDPTRIFLKHITNYNQSTYEKDFSAAQQQIKNVVQEEDYETLKNIIELYAKILKNTPEDRDSKAYSLAYNTACDAITKLPQEIEPDHETAHFLYSHYADLLKKEAPESDLHYHQDILPYYEKALSFTDHFKPEEKILTKANLHLKCCALHLKLYQIEASGNPKHIKNAKKQATSGLTLINEYKQTLNNNELPLNIKELEQKLTFYQKNPVTFITKIFTKPRKASSTSVQSPTTLQTPPTSSSQKRKREKTKESPSKKDKKDDFTIFTESTLEKSDTFNSICQNAAKYLYELTLEDPSSDTIENYLLVWKTYTKIFGQNAKMGKIHHIYPLKHAADLLFNHQNFEKALEIYSQCQKLIDTLSDQEIKDNLSPYNVTNKNQALKLLNKDIEETTAEIEKTTAEIEKTTTEAAEILTSLANSTTNGTQKEATPPPHTIQE